MLLQECLEKYLNYLKLKNYTERTKETYSGRLNHFIGWLFQSGIKKVNRITKETIKNYLSDRHYHLNFNGKQNCSTTRSYERHTLKRFLVFLWENKFLGENISEAVEYIQVPRLRIPRDILSKKELLALFALPDMSTNQGYRDRTVMEILYATGMRHKEIIELKTEDINFKEKIIFIKSGKGQKDRIVPVNDTALKYIRHYIDYIRPCFCSKKTKDSTLFLTMYGKPFTNRELGRNTINPYLKKLCKKKKITLHSFRRTFATHLIQAGAPLRHVQELLGHNDLNTTVKYLQLNIKDLQKEYKKTHPIERLYQDSS